MTSAFVIALLPFAGLVSESTPVGATAAEPVSQVDRLISAASETDDKLLKQHLALELWRVQSDDPRVAALLEQYAVSPANNEEAIVTKTAIDALNHLAASPAFQLSFEDYQVGGVFDGEFDGPFTRIHPQDGKWTLDISDEVIGMARTLRTAVVAQELASHHGHVLGWNIELVESAAFLSGTAVYAENGGIGWAKYRDGALPGVEMSLEESSEWLESGDVVISEKANHLSDWVEEKRGES